MSQLHPSELVAVRTPRADLDVAAFGGGNTDDTSRLFLDCASPIAFQRRIFEEARDTRNPLLERVRFLAILGVNLSRLDSRGGLADAARRLWSEADTYLTRSLRPELVTHGIHLPAEVAFTTSGLDHLGWSASSIGRIYTIHRSSREVFLQAQPMASSTPFAPATSFFTIRTTRFIR